MSFALFLSCLIFSFVSLSNELLSEKENETLTDDSGVLRSNKNVRLSDMSVYRSSFFADALTFIHLKSNWSVSR